MNKQKLARVWANGIYSALLNDHDVLTLPQWNDREKKWDYPIAAIPSFRVMTFRFGLNKPTDLKKVLGLGEQIAFRLGVDNCRITRDRGEVLIEVPLPRTMQKNLLIDELDMSLNEGTWVTLGETTDTLRPVRVDTASDRVAPILVAGRVGAGKTEALKTIIYQLVMQNPSEDLQLLVLDPKGKFAPFSRVPHMRRDLLRRPSQWRIAIRWLVREMRDRMTSGNRSPRIILIVDELMVMADDQTMGEALGLLSSLGREMNINVFGATQRPDRQVITKLFLANAGLRLVGAVGDSRIEAQVAAGRGGTSVGGLSGKGDIVAILPDSNPIRLQVALVSDRAMEKLPHTETPPKSVEEEVALFDFKGILAELTGSMPEPEESQEPRFDPEHYAAALTDIGIIKLREKLHIGQTKATELRRWGTAVLNALRTQGYELVREGE